MNRRFLWPVLVIGLALVVAPFEISLPSNAPAGQRVMDDFQPIMQPAPVQTTAGYKRVNSLPDFGLFTWFFLVPGVLLVLLAGWGLLGGRVSRVSSHPS